MTAIALSITFVLQKKDARACDKALSLLTSYDTVLGGKIDASRARELSPARAYDLDFISALPPRGIQSELQAHFKAEGIKADICVQPAQGRRKMLLICDMDSTLIAQECIDELADFAGVKDRVSAITERAMRGEIGFDGALKERVSLLKGLDISVLERCFQERIEINAGARELCQTMMANGAATVIVSGGFTFFTQKVAQACGFQANQANILLDDGKTLTGDVAMPILGREAKLDALNARSENLGGAKNALAIGDGANDLAMITAAGLGIAYYAKPAVAAAAHCAINYTDLRSALYFQGYLDRDITQ